MKTLRLQIPRRTPGVAFLILLAFAGCGKKAEPAAADKTPDEIPVEMSQAQSRAMETTVTAQGTLGIGQGASARVASSVPGRLLAVNVREGDIVNAGQVIATVDNRTQQAQSRSASAALAASVTQAQSAAMAARAAQVDQSNNVRLAQLMIQSAKLDRDNAVQGAQTALQAAQTDLQKTKAGARPQEIALVDQAVAQAKANRDRAVTEANRVQFLFDKGISAKRQLDDAQTALAVANSALESAQQQASLTRAGARQEEVRAAEIRVQQAQEMAAQARTAGDAKVLQAQAALRQARESALQVGVKQQDARAQQQLAAQKKADLAAAKETASYAQVRAPFRGVVTRRALNPGDMADTTAPIVEIGVSNDLNLLANITAEDGALLRRGMPARITTADAPDRVFTGSVLNIGSVDPQTNLLAVRLAVANARGRLKSGTFATAEIVTEVHPHAIVVPKSAVITREGKSVIYVVGDDHIAHQKEVTVGPERDGLIEVVKGVSPGANVVRLGQYELTDGAKVHPAETKPSDAADSKTETKADSKQGKGAEAQ